MFHMNRICALHMVHIYTEHEITYTLSANINDGDDDDDETKQNTETQ